MFASLQKSLTPCFDCTPFSEGSPEEQVQQDTRAPDLHPSLHLLCLHVQESGSDSSWRRGLGCTKLQAAFDPPSFLERQPPSVTPCSLIFILIWCWAELEGTGGGWKPVKGWLGEEMGTGQEGRRPRAVPGPPALLLLAQLPAGTGTVLAHLGLCC